MTEPQPEEPPHESIRPSIGDYIEAQAFTAGQVRLVDLGRGAREVLRREGLLPDDEAPEPER